MLIKENMGKSRNVVKAILDKTHDYSTVYKGNNDETTLNRLMKHTTFEDMMLKVLETLDDKHINNPVLYGGNRHIHNAIYYGHYQVARELVNRGCNVNVTNKKDLAPIALSNNIEFTKFLLENGADPNLGKSVLGATVMYNYDNSQYIKATESVRHEIALFLANHPLCDVDRNHYGHNNIKYSIDNKWYDVTIAIAERSKHLDNRNCKKSESFTMTPFEYASLKYKEMHESNNGGESKMNDVMVSLAMHSKIFTKEISAFTLEIVKADKDLALQILSNKRFDIETYILMYETFNIVLPHYELVELLDNVEDESLSTKFSKNNVTALIWACMNRYEDMALWILKRYIDVHQTDSMGRSAIYYVNKYRLFRVAKRIREIKKENEELYIDNEPNDLEEINIDCTG
jgi:ankyrin repeat protein